MTLGKHIKNNPDTMKPCPFCGGNVQLHKFAIADIWGIFCPKCGTCFSNQLNESRLRVIKAWNRRDGNGEHDNQRGY